MIKNGGIMKKILVIGAILAILLAGVNVVTAGNGMGPADGAGDCDPNDGPYGPNGSELGHGPAPSAGDGEPEGPEWP
jgi:hypothetical protein